MDVRDRLEQIVGELLAEEVVAAVVRDGWPEPMVREGFELHRRTWDVATVERTIAEELAKFDDPQFPSSIAHLWPALPGAGVTPVLYSRAVGIENILVKPSSRGVHFARAFEKVWRRHDDALRLGDDWRAADRVVVSGSDETVEAVTAVRRGAAVTGYGHRMSVAFVAGDHAPWVAGLATDIVMWHQRGCFSCSAVYCGDGVDVAALGRDLGAAIADAERRLAAELDTAQLAARAQRRGVAELETEVWGDGLGWVELRERWDGESIAPHAVALVPRLPGEAPVALQGVAIGAPPSAVRDLERHARNLGATLTCSPGELQAPPASWPHDGGPNVAGWVI